MRKTFKWILGILLALLVVAVIVGVGYLAVSRWGSVRWMATGRSFQPWNGERVRPWRDGEQPWKNVPRFPMPMHPGLDLPRERSWFSVIGFTRFFPLGMILGGLFWVALIALAVVGVVSLLRGRKTSPPVAAALPVSQGDATVVSTAKDEPDLGTGTCPSCEKPIQKDWRHCPYCGQSLA